MGTFYALSAQAVKAGRLAWANFWLLNVTVLTMIPSLAIVLSGNAALEPVLAVSGLLGVASLLLLLASVIRVWRVKS